MLKEINIMRVAYIRVSTVEQNVDRQLRVDIEKNYIDECSGSIAFKDRPEAKKLLANEDITEIVVHSIDRLGRNTLDIMQTIQEFTSNGINLISEKEGLQTIVDGKENPIAKLMIAMLGSIAEFELNRIKERQAEGIAIAKEKGRYKGRKKGYREGVEKFLNKESTVQILKYVREGESIRRVALLSKTSEGTVKKVRGLIKDGLIKL